MSTKTIYLIRHTNYENPNNIVPLHLPVTLSKQGIAHANKIGHYLKDKNLATIYTSPVKRARQTAEIIAKHTNVPIEVNTHFTEVSNLNVQGMKATDKTKSIHDYPGGETIKEVKDRVIKGFAIIAGKNSNSVIVSHGNPLTVLMFHLKNRPIPDTLFAHPEYTKKGEIVKFNFNQGKLLSHQRINL